MVGIINPSALPPSPIWRHSLFVLINIAGIFLILRRPKWSYIPFLIITFHQIYSHFNRLIKWWTYDNKIDIISIIVILLLPTITALLIIENRNKKHVKK